METLISSSDVYKDEAVISKIIQGEIELFELLIRRYNPVLYRIARSYGFPHPDAEDLMQDTHCTAYQELKQLASPRSYKSWISRIIINKCHYKLKYGCYRHEVSSSRLPDRKLMLAYINKQDTEQIITNKELSAIIEDCIRHLPLSYRLVFVLREIEGFSCAEAAQLLQISGVNVKVRLNRAKAMLRKLLGQRYGVHR